MATIPERRQSLLASVNYELSCYVEPAHKPNPRANLGSILMAIFTLIGMMLLVALFWESLFGGVRIIAKNSFQDSFLTSPMTWRSSSWT